MRDAEEVAAGARRLFHWSGCPPARYGRVASATVAEADARPRRRRTPGASGPWGEGSQEGSPAQATDVVAAEGGEGPKGVDKELEALFQEFCSRGSMCKPAMGVWRPPTDVFETADDVVVKMELAGVRKEDLDVTFEEHGLRIRGRREERFAGKKVAVSQMEVEYGVFERNISVPQPVDADRIEATYSDGFLVVRIPKRRPRRGMLRVF